MTLPTQKKTKHTSTHTHSIESRNPPAMQKLRKLGSGGFGVVWLCVEESSGNILAVKQVPKGIVESTFEEIKRFFLLLRSHKGICFIWAGYLKNGKGKDETCRRNLMSAQREISAGMIFNQDPYSKMPGIHHIAR